MLPLPLTGLAKFFSEGEQPPLSLKSALNPCISPSDCPSARIRPASWSSAFQARDWGSVSCREGAVKPAGCNTDFSAASADSKHTAFIYGGLGVQGQLSAALRGADPHLDSVLPLHDMWRLTADFLTGLFHWKRVEPLHTCSEMSAVGCADVQMLPPAVELATWSTHSRLFMVSTRGEELPICSQANGAAETVAGDTADSGGTELWSFAWTNERWERLEMSDSATYEHDQHQVGPWPGGRCSLLATVDDTGWLLGGVGRYECARNDTNGEFAAAANHSTLHSLVGLWKWEQLDNASTKTIPEGNLRRW